MESEFKDTATAFGHLTDRELLKKRILFRLMSINWLVAFGTALASAALRFGLPVSGLIKSTVFSQFCGGETLEECLITAKGLGQRGVGAILDYAPEAKANEEEFEATKAEILRSIEIGAQSPHVPFAVFKISGVIDPSLLEAKGAQSSIILTEAEEGAFNRGLQRVDAICSAAEQFGQPVFIDAEEVAQQSTIDSIAESMMKKYNRNSVVVFHTVQMYRKDRLDYLESSFRSVVAEGAKYGVKVVRGAYMEKERRLAAARGVPSPIHETKGETDSDYERAIIFCLKHLENLALIAGTHNEESTKRLITLMNVGGVSPEDKRIWFSQLFGMSDNITNALAKAGFNVAKYVPYGPVKDAVPYLARRAQENTAVLGQVSREYEMISREIRRRKDEKRRNH